MLKQKNLRTGFGGESVLLLSPCVVAVGDLAGEGEGALVEGLGGDPAGEVGGVAVIILGRDRAGPLHSACLITGRPDTNINNDANKRILYRINGDDKLFDQKMSPN